MGLHTIFTVFSSPSNLQIETTQLCHLNPSISETSQTLFSFNPHLIPLLRLQSPKLHIRPRPIMTQIAHRQVNTPPHLHRHLHNNHIPPQHGNNKQQRSTPLLQPPRLLILPLTNLPISPTKHPRANRHEAKNPREHGINPYRKEPERAQGEAPD